MQLDLGLRRVSQNPVSCWAHIWMILCYHQRVGFLPWVCDLGTAVYPLHNDFLGDMTSDNTSNGLDCIEQHIHLAHCHHASSDIHTFLQRSGNSGMGWHRSGIFHCKHFIFSLQHYSPVSLGTIFMKIVFLVTDTTLLPKTCQQ